MSNPNANKLGNSVVFASWLAVFTLFGYRTTFSVMLPSLAEALNQPVSNISLGYSFMMVIYAITAFFSGMIIDKYGVRPAYAIASICAFLGYFITSYAQSFVAYLVPYALFAGVGTGMLWVSSTISVRKWYIGKTYGTKWGIAFMGSPMAQVVLSLGVKSILATMDWRVAMRGLAVVSFIMLVIAAAVAKKNPEDYGLEPFGLVKGAGPAKEEYAWTVKEAFGKWAIWGVIFAFLTSMMAEFLIWSQYVSYLTKDVGLPLGTSTNLYITIGICGLATMPLMGIVSDKLVEKFGHEVKARKYMLIFAPACGIVASILLRMTSNAIAFAVVASAIFAIYWAIEPGGAAGYAGAIFGRRSIGKIWGLATLFVMGVGPATGTYLGGLFYDLAGNYNASLNYALGSFIASCLIAMTLPLSVEPNAKVKDDAKIGA